MNASTKQINFAQGSILAGILAFSIPIVLGELLQNLYNSVDAIVVGNLVSERALAAVTVCGLVSNLIVNFFNGMSVGANVVVSMAFGHGDSETLHQKICVTFTFASILGVALSAFGILLTPQLLALAGVLPEYYHEALVYLRIYLAGLMFTVIYNNGAGILRAVGDSQTPFRILLISCVMNIALDLIFVGLLPFGVAGVGLATVFSQGLSVILIYKTINRSQGIRCLNFDELRRRGKEIIPPVLRIGIAAGIQSALIGISNLFVVRYMNLFDTASVAGIGIAQRLDKFIILPAKSFGITMTTYVSQNIGADCCERVRPGKRRCLAAALGVTIGLSLIAYCFTEQCVRLFNSDPAVVAVGVNMMHVLTPFFWVMAVREIYLGVLRGYGKNSMPMLLNLIGMVGCRQLFLSLTMGNVCRIENIFACYPFAWIMTALLQFTYYFAVRKKLKGMGDDK